jgi:hypothetical protein
MQHRGVYCAVRRAALFVAALVSSGCLVVSLQPAYDAQSVVFDETLLGHWESTDEGAKATVERGEWRSYKIAYTDRFATRAFQGNLTKVDTATFLDVTALRGVDPGPYLVPTHGLFRIQIDGDSLTASPIDYTWFNRAMAQKLVVRLAPAIDDRRNAVIAAGTPEIRRWLARAPEDAFAAPMTFQRK